MSKTRHEPTVRGYAVTHPPGRAVLPIEPGWDQLVYAASGIMTVQTPAGSWAVPPQRALWIPDSDPATIINRSRVAVRTLYIAATLQTMTDGARAIEVSGLVREVLLQLIRLCPLDLAVARHKALLTVLTEELRRSPELALLLPAPRDPRAVDAGVAITAEPGRPLAEIARQVGTSRRTLERAFRSETGLTLGSWRRRARILDSLEALSNGSSITHAAARAGYATPSAYVAAFRAELGRTPRRYLSG